MSLNHLVILFSLSVLASACTLEPANYCATQSYPNQEESAYVLPYAAGESRLIIQGNCGRDNRTHNANSAIRYAYDIAVPIGTPIIAARSGKVRRVVQNNIDSDNQPGAENFVVITHDDGSFGMYQHLTYQGATVQVDDWVQQGQIIGLSGNTGKSSEPEIHFHVLQVKHDYPCDIRDRSCVIQCADTDVSCSSIAVTFRNTRQHNTGLQEGQSYLATAIEPDYLYKFSPLK